MEGRVADRAQLVERRLHRSDVVSRRNQQHRLRGEAHRERLVARGQNPVEELDRRPLRLGQKHGHRARCVDGDTDREGQIVDQLELGQLLRPPIFEDAEVRPLEIGHRPPVVVEDGGEQLDQVDLDLLEVLRRVQKADVLAAAAVVENRGHRQIGGLPALGHVDLGRPRSPGQLADQGVVEAELHRLDAPLLGHDDLRPRGDPAGQALPRRRLGDSHPERAARLVDRHLVRGHQLALGVVALDPNQLLARVARQPHLGGEGRLAAGQLHLAVDLENDPLDALTGDQNVGAPEPQNEIAVGGHEQQAVVAGDAAEGELLAHREHDVVRHRQLRRLRVRLLGHGELATEVELTVAELVLEPEAEHEFALRPQRAVEGQGQRHALRRRRQLEAHPKLLEQLPGLLDDADHDEPVLGSLLVGIALELGVRGQGDHHPREHPLADRAREGERDVVHRDLRRQLLERGGGRLQRPCRQIGRRLAEDRDLFVGRPLLAEASQPVDAGRLVHEPHVLAGPHVDPALEVDFPELGQQVGHLLVVEGTLGVERDPEPVRAVGPRLVEDELPGAVVPDLERVERGAALDLLAQARPPVQEQHDGAVVEQGEELVARQGLTALNADAQLVLGRGRIRVLAQELLDPGPPRLRVELAQAVALVAVDQRNRRVEQELCLVEQELVLVQHDPGLVGARLPGLLGNAESGRRQ